MNILEMEDMVKGLPDQVLTQYAQFPDPQVPQFLALSEMQRRQDMRQRFQAQQQGAEPTVKDQILQGGIASAGGPPPAPMGAAPPGAAPPGAPMQQPMTGAPMPPMSMAQGGLTPGGIVRMQQGRAVPFSYESLTPVQLRKMAEVFGSLGMYPTGGLDRRSFNNLPIEKRQQLFAALERDSQSNAPSTQSSVSQNLSEQNAPLVQQGRNLRESIYLNPATTQSRYLNPPVKSEAEKEQALAEFRRVTGRDSGPEQEGLGSFLIPSPQVSPYASVFNNVPQTKSRYLNPRAKSPIERLQGLIEFKKVTGRDYSAEQAQLDELLRSQPVPESVAPEVRPPNRPFLRELDVAPDATATPPAPTDEGLGSLDRPPTMTMDSQVMDMLSKALAPQASPLEAEYEALVRSAMAEGLPPPVDLATYAQAAETRAQTARDEAKRMALAATLGRLGAAVAEGDFAKGIREATTDVQQTLKEGAREARTEEARAEALRLQSAESQRQATIQARQFELQSIGSLAQIAREKGASERQAQLTATNIYADYRAQLQRNVADLQQQGALNARSFANAMENAEKMALDYIEALIQPTEEQKQEVLDRFRRQALATYGYLLSEDHFKKVSANLAKKGTESQTEKSSNRKYEVSEVPGT